MRLKSLGHEVTLYYSNSNIDTIEEFKKRLESLRTLAKAESVDLIVDEYRHDVWLSDVALGLEGEPEKGKRCAKCYRFNLARTAAYAREHGFDAFTTSLTVSPHKPSLLVFAKGSEVENEFAVLGKPFFLQEDFKKREGFKISLQRSKGLNLYRQTYCGCGFSNSGQISPVRSSQRG